MPHRPKHYFSISDTLQLSMQNWTRLGLISKPNCRKTLHWQGSKASMIENGLQLTVNAFHSTPYIRLVYTYEGQMQDYQIPLVKKKANTGQGHVWYLVPEPGMFCRKLYFHGGLFKGRKQIPEARYRCQILSGKSLMVDKLKSKVKKNKQILLYEKRKYYKPIYGKKWTKHQLKVQAAFAEMEKLANMNLLNNVNYKA